MEVVPAIDLLAGQPVRLYQGQFDRVRRYASPAVELASQFAQQGAERLHVIDLDGARAGHWRNLELIREIAGSVSIPVQAGGGARGREEIAAGLRLGLDRVIISTAALGPQENVRMLLIEFGDRLVVSLDVRETTIVTDGWTASSEVGLRQAGRAMVDCGASRLIYTDVLRDGTLGGPGVDGLELLLPLGVPVMVAGGVGSDQDLASLRDRGAEAAIVGRALLDGTISLSHAIQVGSPLSSAAADTA
jgi:phosphoribosylformimino-5-aminoimidazole carboxamide ribotide isomerase